MQELRTYGIRNAQLTLLAPTGSISFVMDCDTTGIEPLFARKTLKTLSDGSTMEIVPKCVQIAKEKLIPSLEKFNLNHSVVGVPNLGNWYKNTAYKAKFIKDYLVEYPFPYSIVLLDVDAVIEKPPVLFSEIPEEYDIALHYLDWGEWYGHSKGTKELLTGTMMFRNRRAVRAMCEEWYAKAIIGNTWEQKVLEKIIDKYDLKIYQLPREYIYIDTLPNGQKSKVSDENVVIRHFQASREWKRKIPILDMLKKRNKND
jgi:hypothetical protein